MNNLQPIIRLADEGETIGVVGVTVIHKARSAETGGAWSLVHYTMPPHFKAAPPHYHDQMIEAFYILAGECTIQVGEERVTAPAGSFVSIPPGVLHTINNDSSEPVTFLLFFTPGGFENYFDDVAQLLAAESAWPPSDMSKLQAIQAKYDMRYPEKVKA